VPSSAQSVQTLCHPPADKEWALQPGLLPYFLAMDKSPIRPATPSHPKISITVIATVMLCLLSTARLLTETPDVRRQGSSSSNVARQSDERFAVLRQALPKRGVVGYIGDSGETNVAAYYLAQYALTPLVVEYSSNPSLVIGNFRASQSLPPAVAEENLVLVRNFGDGLFLFAKKDSK